MIEKLAVVSAYAGGAVSSDQPGSFGPVVVRRRLGAILRSLREEANLRLEQVAGELEVSPSKISRLETGHSVPKTWDVRNLLTVYGMTDQQRISEILRWVDESKAVGWWHPFSDAAPTDLDYYMSLEAEAASVSQFCTPTIPGLLQTPDYARAQLSGALGDIEDIGEAEINGLVNIRLRRQEALYKRGRSLEYSLIIDEVALIKRVGNSDIMRRQLQHVIGLTSESVESSSEPTPTTGSVHLRVRPLHAPSRRFAMSPFAIFVPRLATIDRTIVNIEAAGLDYYVEEPSEILGYQNGFNRLWNDSLSESDSLQFIKNLLE